MLEGERIKKNQLYLVTLMFYENAIEGGILGQSFEYDTYQAWRVICSV